MLRKPVVEQDDRRSALPSRGQQVNAIKFVQKWVFLVIGFVAFLVLFWSVASDQLLVQAVSLDDQSSNQSEIPIYDVEVVNTYPHDINSFTQGLEYADGLLYEGTGKNGQSRIRIVDLKTGRPQKERLLPNRYFGEGITLWKDTIAQLTWTSGQGFVFDKDTLKVIGQFRYQGEGWGLCHNETHLIMSDGTSTIRFLDPESFETRRTIRVKYQNRSIDQINELEYINGEIFANIWNTTYIIRISPDSGEVVGWIDLSTLRPRRRIGTNAVLNGIAYDAQGDRLFVTGKNWSDLFEIRLIAR